jgi:hypothetical protein
MFFPRFKYHVLCFISICNLFTGSPSSTWKELYFQVKVTINICCTRKCLATGFTDSRLSQLFSGDVDPILGWLHHAEVGCDAKDLEKSAPSLGLKCKLIWKNSTWRTESEHGSQGCAQANGNSCAFKHLSIKEHTSKKHKKDWIWIDCHNYPPGTISHTSLPYSVLCSAYSYIDLFNPINTYDVTLTSFRNWAFNSADVKIMRHA